MAGATPAGGVAPGRRAERDHVAAQRLAAVNRGGGRLGSAYRRHVGHRLEIVDAVVGGVVVPPVDA